MLSYCEEPINQCVNVNPVRVGIVVVTATELAYACEVVVNEVALVPRLRS